MPTHSDGSSELLDDYWLPSEQIILRLLAEVMQPGELNFLRDLTMLGSAVARPLQLLAYEGDQPVHVLASAVSTGLAKNHAFVDGNKRVAFAALELVLGENGYRLTLTNDEAVDLMEGIAKAPHEHGFIEEPKLIDIVANNHEPWPELYFEIPAPPLTATVNISRGRHDYEWRVRVAIRGIRPDFETTKRTYKRALDAALAYLSDQITTLPIAGKD